MVQRPAAFLSYAHVDDRYGDVTEFRERLSHEVEVLIGEQFPIFQDRQDIQWGQNWKDRLEQSLDQVTFLIGILSPGFFKSPECRAELTRFLAREQELGRKDLVLPVYYVDCPLLNDRTKADSDSLAQVLAERQYSDWRELRVQPLTSTPVRKEFEHLAIQIRDALERALSTAGQTTAPPSSPTDTTTQSLVLEPPPSIVETRPPAKTEPRTRVVDLMDRGDHLTISEAIEKANPGDRILVRPGLYQEGVVIEKPLEIVGEGPQHEIVIQAVGKPAALFKATMGRLANLTLRQSGGAHCFAVDIVQGRLDLEECDITSQSSACVAIHGGADPRLRQNLIHNGSQAGVLVYDNGLGTLEDNDICGNGYSGVEIRTAGNPTLHRNRIHDGTTGGVLVHEEGLGTFEDNDIFNNGFSGVTIKTGGNPSLRRNRVHSNSQSGVLVHDYGQGTLEDNDIFGNGLSGITIQTGGKPKLRSNRIRDNKKSGLFVHSNGRGILEDNDIFGNTLSGVAIKTGGKPILRRNRIHENQSEAVRVYERGGGTIEDNDLRGNTKGAWNVSADSKPNVQCARNQE